MLCSGWEKARDTLTSLLSCGKAIDRSPTMIGMFRQMTLILYMVGLTIHHKQQWAGGTVGYII